MFRSLRDSGYGTWNDQTLPSESPEAGNQNQSRWKMYAAHAKKVWCLKDQDNLVIYNRVEFTLSADKSLPVTPYVFTTNEDSYCILSITMHK